jgi:hypothetical protein
VIFISQAEDMPADFNADRWLMGLSADGRATAVEAAQVLCLYSSVRLDD